MLLRCFNGIIWAVWFCCLFTCFFPLSVPRRESLCVVQWSQFVLFDYYAIGGCVGVACMRSLFLKMKSGVWKSALICRDGIMRREFALPLCRRGWTATRARVEWRYVKVFADIHAFYEALSWTIARFIHVKQSKWVIFTFGWRGMDVKRQRFIKKDERWKRHTNKKYCRHNESDITYFQSPSCFCFLGSGCHIRLSRVLSKRSANYSSTSLKKALCVHVRVWLIVANCWKWFGLYDRFLCFWLRSFLVLVLGTRNNI